MDDPFEYGVAAFDGEYRAALRTKVLDQIGALVKSHIDNGGPPNAVERYVDWKIGEVQPDFRDMVKSYIEQYGYVTEVQGEWMRVWF